jgi:UDP-N-acetylmuramoyl-tripeptide--D-alanyl-D-alanine ligase
MGELGPRSRALHAELGNLAHRRSVDKLFTVGALAEAAAQEFGAGARHFEDQAALAAALRAALHENVVCLIKGSRAAAMEQVVAALAAGGADHAA